MAETVHTFHALAFVENFSLRDLAALYPEAKRTHHQLWYAAASGGTVYLFASGAVVFQDMGQAGREMEVQRLRRALPKLSDAQVLTEEFSVREVPGARPDIQGGVLVLDELTFERAGVVTLTIAQSAAMEYYERIVDQMFTETDRLVERLEKSGTMPIFTRKLHQFIGAAIGTRSEVLSVLHLFDKPDAAWDDPGAEKIYEELRAEFDLVDRHNALELKLRSVQDALELVTDIARDKRLVWLEVSIVLLIVLEIALRFVGH
ncbi:MAG TPA: RMD1 family protein [Polyangia bacterium]|nr:RMD1 family protein [Polyangia bacterium]